MPLQLPLRVLPGNLPHYGWQVLGGCGPVGCGRLVAAGSYGDEDGASAGSGARNEVGAGPSTVFEMKTAPTTAPAPAPAPEIKTPTAPTPDLSKAVSEVFQVT
ncbi:hypothetical protein [Paenibacillus silviterrae]|uniref:hypothetical protein n=1 Tax=Paenibacillus silviterrae TaxID=3242194 RepID=UPI002543D2A4|nr:hypothetical protein [Paenibacillus chinjuensis]